VTASTAGTRLSAAERKREIIKLRRDGLTFHEIGEQVACTPQYAFKVVRVYLERVDKELSEEVAQLRRLESERLDRAHRAVWPKAIKGDLRAIDRVLRIMERRARLFGLDAPQKRELTGKDGRPLVGGGLAALLEESDDGEE